MCHARQDEIVDVTTVPRDQASRLGTRYRYADEVIVAVEDALLRCSRIGVPWLMRR